jgi:succinate dehydrogenase / fumarate reductase cytochrome b subunit
MSGPLCKYFGSSIGKKQIMAISGLLLCGFLITHLAGNCLMYLGPDAFNTYAHKLTSNKLLLYPAEIILILLFTSHIVMAVRVTIENKSARPEPYFMSTKSGRGATLASRSMPYTGLVILIFLILHLIHFKFGPYYETQLNGEPVRDIYRTVMEYFQSPINVIWYVTAMICLGFHVKHGFWSAFQSLGFYHEKYNCKLKMASCLFALTVTCGFSALCIWAYFKGV